MGTRIQAVVVMGILMVAGCGGGKPTNELLGDLSSGSELDRVKAVRLLQHHKSDASKVVPALIKSLKDKSVDIRWSAAIGLGYFGSKAESALPALEDARQDKDARVREASRVAISRIKD